MSHSVSVIVLVIIAVAEGCRPPPCHWSDPKPIENYFKQVANDMIAADRKAQRFCNQHSTPNVREVHTAQAYKLFYPSGGVEVYSIKVRDRVVQVRGENCMGVLADVRVLPSYVTARGASYAIDGPDLVISFPYKFNPVLGGGVCVPPDPTVITLPQGCVDDCNNIYK